MGSETTIEKSWPYLNLMLLSKYGLLKIILSLENTTNLRRK